MATLKTPEKLRNLQRALYLRAKKEPKFRAYALYDKVYRRDVLEHAYALARANRGAPGPDGKTFEEIDAGGAAAMLEELREELKTKKYRPGAVRRVYIPKLNGGERPLGIPNIRDRVVQTAAKLLLEPLFEADFEKDSYGFRPNKNAHQALEAIGQALNDGMRWVIDAEDVGRGAAWNGEAYRWRRQGVRHGGLIAQCRERNVAPHVAQNITPRRDSAIDTRTTRHSGYWVSQRIRKQVEEIFGWEKTVRNFRKTRYRGERRTQLASYLLAAAYNLIRMRSLLAQPA